jgi:hypothetical protein
MDSLFREYTGSEKSSIEVATPDRHLLIFLKFVRTVFGPRVLVFDYHRGRIFMLLYTPDFAMSGQILLTRDGRFREVFLQPDDGEDFQDAIIDGTDKALSDFEGCIHVTYTDRRNGVVKYLSVFPDGSSGFSIEPMGSFLHRTEAGRVGLVRPGWRIGVRAGFTR